MTLFSIIILVWTYYIVANHCFEFMLNYNIYIIFVSPTSGLISVININVICNHTSIVTILTAFYYQTLTLYRESHQIVAYISLILWIL